MIYVKPRQEAGLVDLQKGRRAVQKMPLAEPGGKGRPIELPPGHGRADNDQGRIDLGVNEQERSFSSRCQFQCSALQATVQKAHKLRENLYFAQVLKFQLGCHKRVLPFSHSATGALLRSRIIPPWS